MAYDKREFPVKDCKMRLKNGNCIPAGGFCTANRNICAALQSAYHIGYFASVKDFCEREKNGRSL